MGESNKIDIRFLVNQTMEENIAEMRFSEPRTFIENLKMKEVKPGFYSIKNRGRWLDIPSSWSVFEKISEDHVVDLLIEDPELNSVFCTFFAKNGSFKISKVTDGINVFYAPMMKIKKAA
jgi:hypothetical protein